jgi:hypothetical protein
MSSGFYIYLKIDFSKIEKDHEEALHQIRLV